MFWEYNVHIVEKREDGFTYSVYDKTFFNFNKACREAAKVIDRMTGEPVGVVIWKTLIGGFSIPDDVFRFGESYFNKVDYYL